ncbi:PGF-pre-PGF domain-containing protein [Methanoculleus sp. FWC-SCC1]|uniref:glucan endo-1,3-beta-D-glucosidase n=1 Tax=Methanoculleus frigidifontis TaxID=2584085 RepID=A0ABT8M6S2_9EURY|nr:glycosyl hydrolase [Methanoculleus sp. FWC-SCC1]MDN7023626.1 PGF-pre-PGF domain-containing protein [Methanoculleus sp. FWC-SCC1]
MEFVDALGLGKPVPVQGLLPIHYGDFFGLGSVLEGTPAWVENGTGSGMAFETVKGSVQYLRQPSFTCRYHYPGILPFMPPLDTHDATGVDNLTRWIDVFKTAYEHQKPAYTAFDDGRGTDTYTGAKILGRNARFALAAEGAGNATLAGSVASSTKSGGIRLFFRENPTNTQADTSTGVAPYYALYNASIGTLLIYPASPVNTYFPSDTPVKPYDGYGTVTRLNDHHYTYGYIVNAAALLAMENETWMNEYKEAINQIVFDVAYTTEIQNTYAFPEMRYWDAYTGHCAAGGLVSPDFLTDNNDESISEEINFWAGAILWGTASNQPEMTQIGIEHYTVAIYANWAYWRDHFGTYQRLFDAVEGPGYDPRWVSTQYTAQVYDAQVKQSTFFGPHPTDISYITVAPITPASFYHAMDPAAIRTYQQQYEAYLKQYNLDPINPDGKERFGNNETANQWYGQLAYYSELACWYAMAEPDAALAAYFDVAPDWTVNEYGIIPCVMMTHGGNSGATTYQFIRYLQVHGTPDPLEVYATNTPYFMTFVKNGERTYAAYNPTDAPLDVAFSDGTVLKGVPAHTLRTYPTGMPGPLAAGFTANVTQGNAPLPAGFTDTSAGALTGWAWSIDGAAPFSTDQNTEYTFDAPGVYNVTLTVANRAGASSSVSEIISVKQPGTLSAPFVTATIDPMAGVGSHSSLTLDADGSAHIGYYDQTNRTARYAWTNGTWQSEPVFGSDGGIALALDGNGTPHIAYGNAAGTSLNAATRQGENWTNTQITPVGSAYPSLVMSSSHGPCVAFQSVPLQIPRFSWAPPGTAGDWPVVDVEPPASRIGGNYVSLAQTSDQQPHVSYSTAKALKHAWMPTWGAPEKWVNETVATANVAWTSMGVDADGHPTIAYYDAGAKHLMYAINGSSWTTEVVDAAGDVGRYCSLAFNPMPGSDHAPGISYYDATNRSLKYAWKDGAAWYSTTVDTGNVGKWTSLAIDEHGHAHISYADAGNRTLKHAVQRPVDAAFLASARSGTAPLTVQFTDVSTGDGIVGWEWDMNTDGVADSAHQHPVHVYTEPGTYTVTLIVRHASGAHDTETATDHIVVTAPQAGSSGGGGGSGTGSSAGSASSLQAGQSATIAVDAGAMNSLTVTVGSDVQRLLVTVTPSGSLPSSVPSPTQTVYEFQEITPYWADAAAIDQVVYTFTVSKVWLAEQGSGPGDVVLLRYNGTAWEALPTTYADEGTGDYTFAAVSPGFSWYAVAIEEGATLGMPTATTAPDTAPATITPSPAQTTPAPLPAEPVTEIPMFAAVGAILVIAAAGAALWYRETAKKP